MAKDTEATLVVYSCDGEVRGTYVLDGDRLTVGRPTKDWQPDIPLESDAQMWVSRLHCRLERVDGTMHVVDNDSVNGTFVQRSGSLIEVQGRVRLQHGDEALILGKLEDGVQGWWRLRFRDPYGTVTVPGRSHRNHSSSACLHYDLAGAKLYIVEGDQRIQVDRLGPNVHQLVRYMAKRNHDNNGSPWAGTHQQLIEAVWGEPETWPPGRFYTRENMRDLVFELRKRLRPYDDLVENVKGIGYLLRTCPGP